MELLETAGEWVKVRVRADGTEGWVFATHTRQAALPSPEPTRAKDWRIVVSVLLGFSLLIRLAKGFSSETDGNAIPAVLGGLITGVILILNQFGDLVARQLEPHADITVLSWLWKCNAMLDPFGYREFFAALLLLFTLTCVAAPAENGCRQSFYQGFTTGMLGVPALTLAIAATALALWVLGKIFVLIGLILHFVAIPFRWLFEHALLPLLRFLAIPFVWLWEHFLSELAALIAIPFVWLWSSILAPALKFLVKYVITPLIPFVVGALISTAVMLPIAAIGRALLEAVRTAVSATLDRQGLFSQGVSLGLLTFDAALLVALGSLGILQSSLPLSMFVMLGLATVTLARLLVRRPRGSDNAEQTVLAKLKKYYETSQLEIVVSCAIAPALLITQIHLAADD